jgi:flagellar hook-length control protein FliK
VEIDSARLLLRVARAFAQAADGRGEVTIRLNPPELGSLRLEVRMHEGALAARMQTETAEARTAILENLPILRERLADQGVRIERFDVDLMNRQPGDSPQQPFGEQRESPRAPRAAAAIRPPINPLATTPTMPRASQADPGRLNVIV